MHAVEDDAASHIFVEPLVEQVAEEAAALRNPDGDGRARSALEREWALVADRVGSFVAQKGDGVPDGRESQPHDDGILRPVHELIDRSAIETRWAFDSNLAGVAIAPGQIARCRSWTRQVATYGELGMRGVEGRRLVTQGRIRDSLGVVEDEFLERSPNDRRAVRVPGHREEGHDVRLRPRQVALPADSDQRESHLQESHFGRAGAAAIGNRVVKRPIPATHVDRAVDLDGRAVFDPSVSVEGSVLEVDDAPVTRVRRIDLTIETAP